MSHVPMRFVRAMAGLPQAQGHYYLARGKIVPPQNLQDMVFPRVSYWKDTVNDSSRVFSDIAATGFLRLLTYFRVVILQDAVLLRAKYPLHPMWNAPVFHHPDFQTYSAAVMESLDSQGTLSFKAEWELFAGQFIALAKDMEARRVQDAFEAKSRHDELTKGLQMMRMRVAEDTYRSLESVQLVVPSRVVGGQLIESGWEQRLRELATLAGKAAVSGAPTPGGTQPLSSLLPGADASAVSRQEMHQPATYASASASASGSGSIDPPSLPPLDGKCSPVYKLNRSIRTVAALWQEYTVGINGMPSVQRLNLDHNTSWRNSACERMYYSKRKVIYDEIEARAIAYGKPPHYGQAVIDLDHLMRAGNFSSLDKLAKVLKERNKKAGVGIG